VLEFPADDIGPLVDFKRQISVRLDPLGISRLHDGFRRGPDGDVFRQFRLALACDPGDFG